MDEGIERRDGAAPSDDMTTTTPETATVSSGIDATADTAESAGKAPGEPSEPPLVRYARRRV